MAFDYDRLNRLSIESIYERFRYDTNDTVSEVQEDGYFELDKFNLKNNTAPIIECKCSNGTVIVSVNEQTQAVVTMAVSSESGGVSNVSESSGGYGVYGDTQYTSTPLVVTSGATVKLSNNAGSVIEELPAGSNGFYDGSVITPDALGDAYIVRLGFEASSSINNGALNVAVDISAAGDGSIVISGDPERMIRGSNTYQRYSISLPIFCRETFVANGGHVLFSAVDGNISVRNISFFITKLYSGA